MFAYRKHTRIIIALHCLAPILDGCRAVAGGLFTEQELQLAIVQGKYGKEMKSYRKATRRKRLPISERVQAKRKSVTPLWEM